MSDDPTHEHTAGNGLRRVLRVLRREKPDQRGIDLALDRDGNRYTTRCFADYGDPWWGATILTSGVVRDLRERGMLPLTECPIPPDKGDDTV